MPKRSHKKEKKKEKGEEGRRKSGTITLNENPKEHVLSGDKQVSIGCERSKPPHRIPKVPNKKKEIR
jgi:hypothetical protein